MSYVAAFAERDVLQRTGLNRKRGGLQSRRLSGMFGSPGRGLVVKDGSQPCWFS